MTASNPINPHVLTDILDALTGQTSNPVNPNVLTNILDAITEGAIIPGYIVNQWYALYGPVVASVGAASVANSMRIAPIFVKQPVTISNVGIRVNTVFSGGKVQAAIYANNPTIMKPTGNALVTSGDISTTSAGAITAAFSIALAKGLYWTVTNCDNATAAIASIAGNSSYFMSIFGDVAAGGIGGAGSVTVGYFVSQTFGTWPDLTAQSWVSGFGVQASTIPMLALKVASVP